MSNNDFAQLLILLGCTVAVVLLLQRLRVPTLLAYLLVGVLIGPHTPGPVVDPGPMKVMAEFGIVFLLFTIGLSFSIPQLQALRHVVLGLGTAQVALTTAAVGLLAWLAGLPAAAAFVVGAVFAQSSTTIIGRQLAEQAEEQTRHGRLALAMSVFQDVTAVPFIVIIPVLGTTVSAGALGTTLLNAMVTAALAIGVVVLAGRWLLKPLFHLVAERRSAELFTLTVLLVTLAASAMTHTLGLSMAFGAFLAGMVLGETEFRHQVESAIRPFRDVLLGLFFIGVGMLFNPSDALAVWHWAIGGALALLGIKALLVFAIARLAKIDPLNAWRTGLTLAVGGEFGFALLAIGLDGQAIDARAGQIVLTSVLLSMVLAPFLIRHSHAIATRLAGPAASGTDPTPLRLPTDAALLSQHAIICGYGRIGQNVGRVLEQEAVPFVALDLDAARVRQANQAGERVFFADAGERDILEAVGLVSARLVVVSHNDVAAAIRTLRNVRSVRPDVPVMVRTRDETHVEELRAAGATEVVPETLETGLMIATHALLLLDVPPDRVLRRFQDERSTRYRLLRELVRGDDPAWDGGDESAGMQPVQVPADGGAVAGKTLDELGLSGVVVTAIVRRGRRRLAPPGGTRLEAGDTLVLSGEDRSIDAATRIVQG